MLCCLAKGLRLQRLPLEWLSQGSMYSAVSCMQNCSRQNARLQARPAPEAQAAGVRCVGHLPDEIAQERKSAQKPALADGQGFQCSCFLPTPCFAMLPHRLLLHSARPGHGYCRLQHCPLECASRGICLIRLSRITTTSSKLGRLSGLGSQHLVTIFFSVCTSQCQHRSHFASPRVQYLTQTATCIFCI